MSKSLFQLLRRILTFLSSASHGFNFRGDTSLCRALNLSGVRNLAAALSEPNSGMYLTMSAKSAFPGLFQFERLPYLSIRSPVSGSIWDETDDTELYELLRD